MGVKEGDLRVRVCKGLLIESVRIGSFFAAMHRGRVRWSCLA